MIRLRFLGDGPLDEATVPHLVRNVVNAHLGREVHFVPRFAPWARLHIHGYEKKVAFAIRQAEDAGESGLIATVDRDRSPRRSRLKALREGRGAARARRHLLPVALGEANPHAEAWLLADQTAVQQALGLAPGTPIGASGRSPKDELQALLQSSSRCQEPRAVVWADVAVRARPDVIEAVRDIGFSSFADELRRELASVL